MRRQQTWAVRSARHAHERRPRLIRRLAPLAFIALLTAAWHLSGSPTAAAEPKSQPGSSKAEKGQWRCLFDGKTLAGWKATNYGGQGEVYVEDGAIILEMGSSLTGITGLRDIPTVNYELALEAKRLDGVDFFCALTFPVKDSHCTLVVGGWAGAVVGLSSLDGHDASENETTRFMSFKTDQWYPIRVQVRPQRIRAWIDGKQVVDVSIEGRRVSTRAEVDLSRPYGIASWETRAAVRNVRVRRLPKP